MKLKASTSLLLLTSSARVATCVPFFPSYAASGLAEAVYFMSNEPNNSVVALTVNSDGTLSAGTITSSGGQGGSGITAGTNNTAGPDSLFSQGALQVSGNIVAAVNPGSSTFSLFAITPNDPTNLTLLSTTSTQGEFPVSIALHPFAPVACIANSGSMSGVSCFSYSPLDGTTTPMGALRAISFNQSTPPMGPASNSLSQVFFTEAGTALVASVKFSGMANTTAQTYIYPVDPLTGVVGDTATISNLSDVSVLFGGSIIDGSHGSQLLLSDATYGVALAGVDPFTHSAHTLATLNLTQAAGAAAPCWTFYSHETNSVLIGDVARARFLEIGIPYVSADAYAWESAAGSFPAPEVLGAYNITGAGSGNPGLVDMTGRGGLVYGLAPASTDGGEVQVSVLDLRGGAGKGKVIQTLVVPGVTGRASEGIAVWP